MRMYRTRGEWLLAACDRELLGKTFSEGEFIITISEKFYFEAFVSEQTFINSMKIATIANLVGTNVINIAVREGYIDSENIIKIDGVPHAQMVLI
uniref:DUF424 domain-containing protein n=1 Tax=uncultured euryarchaeote Alv-FOS1 TaxID=337892 RepID=Q3SAC6_9EURY|nr:hypothetical protein [uncultured euryarchaeote Alv-FOS1]